MKAQPSSVRMLPEQTNLSAWRELLAQTAPDASQTLIEQQSQLLPRFAAYYTKLQQLPRRVRRNLQGQFCRAGFNPPASANDSALRPHECGPTGSYADLPRRVRREWKRSVAGLALMLALGQMPALAATINVGGGCKLVDAITAANTDNAIGLCRAGSGTDIIALKARSTHTLTAINNSTPYGPTGLPVVTSAITIAGNGSTITRPSSAPAFRILAVGLGGNLTLRETTISGGAASGPGFAGGGGGVFVAGGALTVAKSVILRNAAVAGGGVQAGEQANLVITDSTVSGNTAGFGGGVIAARSTATFTNSTVSGNIATRVGGGVYNAESRVTLTNSTVSGNLGGDRGGGLNIRFGLMTLTNSTVSGNRAAKGGGVFSDGSFGNFKSEVVLNRSLVSGNTATVAGAEVYQLSGGTTTGYNSNLFGHSGLTTAQALGGKGSIITGLDIIATSDGGGPVALTAILNPTLANNGGVIQTHALAAKSPAIDGAGSCPFSKTDQRGVPRPQDGNNDGNALCDIGAFERVRPDTITCDGLPATLVGTNAADTISGTAGIDVVHALGGNDIIKGLGGNDVLCGGIGNDQVLGGAGDDRLFGEADKDSLNGEAGFDRCDRGPSGQGDTVANCEQVNSTG